MSISSQRNADCLLKQNVSSAIKLHEEFRLVLECARGCEQKEASWERPLQTAGTNWDMLIQTARRHRMIPWVYRSLRDCPQVRAPSDVREQLRRRTQQIAMRSLFLTGELLRVLDHMSAAGIRAIPFKGPLLGSVCYGDLSLRECDDLDVLVPTDEIWRATKLLQALGYDFWKPCSKPEQRRLLTTDCAFTLAHKKSQVHLDLHWKFTAAGFSFPFKMDPLWRRLKPLQLANRQVLSLPQEDVILLHCVHGAKHQWERLEWVYALAGLLRSNSSLNWDSVLSQAHQLRVERMLLLGLKLASELFESILPNAVLDRMEQDAALPSLVAQSVMRLVSQEDATVQEAQQYAFHFRMRESWRDRIRYLIYLMGRKMAPTARDHEAIPLPAFCSGLYYLARPFRLVHTYGLSPLKRFFSRLRSA